LSELQAWSQRDPSGSSNRYDMATGREAGATKEDHSTKGQNKSDYLEMLLWRPRLQGYSQWDGNMPPMSRWNMANCVHHRVTDL